MTHDESSGLAVKIALQTIVSTLTGLLFFGMALFVPARTFHYWQAWTFIAVFAIATILPSLYLAARNPAALARRLTGGPAAETRPVQRVIISATVLLVVATLVVSALDHRFEWSTVPLAAVVVGDVLVASGLVIAQLVVMQNAYASARITVEADQPLVSTGLYGVVRHPMYLGALIMLIGTPLALDSWRGLLVVVVAAPVLAARVLDEEKMLRLELTGYEDYARVVRYRLAPGLW